MGFKIICNKCGNEVELRNRDDGYETSIMLITGNDNETEIVCSKCKYEICIE